jgi:hypothetical protein
VDHEASCPASSFAGSDGGVEVTLEVSDWGAWLKGNLQLLEDGDQIVPYHFAPHLFRDWLAGELVGQGAHIEQEVPPPMGVPYELVTSKGERALSYATWLCPTFCIEPDLCPHTRGRKDWSLVADLLRQPADVFDRAVFPCLHFVYGVGTVPVGMLLSARERFLGSLAAKPRRYLVATTSHCHALSSVICASL